MAAPAGQGEQLIPFAVGRRPLPVAVETLAVSLDDHPQLRPGAVDDQRPAPAGYGDRMIDERPLDPSCPGDRQHHQLEPGANERGLQGQDPFELRDARPAAPGGDELTEAPALQQALGLGGDEDHLELSLAELGRQVDQDEVGGDRADPVHDPQVLRVDATAVDDDAGTITTSSRRRPHMGRQAG